MVFFVYYVKKNKHGNVRIVRLLESFVDKDDARKYCMKHSSKNWGKKLPIAYGHVENVKYFTRGAKKCYVVEERDVPSNNTSLNDKSFHMVTYVNKRDDDDYQDEIVFLTETLQDAEDFVNGGFEGNDGNDQNNDGNIIVYQGCCSDVFKYYKPGSYVVIEHVIN